jgi:peptidoglycan hydrolase-like protein with peptidoglycan-binding domain
MADGPDVAELESNLIANGDAAGLLSVPTAHFSALTALAVTRWQSRLGLAADGQVPLGQVVFLPSAIVVGAETVAAAQAATPGDIPYQVTTATRTVTVPVTPNVPDTYVGESVSIVLPNGASTRGHIVAVGPAPPSTGTNSSGSSNDGSSNGGNVTQASAILTIAPDDPAVTGDGVGTSVQVSLPVQSATDVLAVPISALLALAGGGYGLEVVDHGGGHHLVGVTTGLFTASQVQISGSGIDAGTKVVVSQ